MLSSITTFWSLFQMFPSRALRRVKLSTNSFNSLLLRSPASSPQYHSNTSPMQRLFHPSRRIHPAQKFACNRPHDLNSSKVRALADLFLTARRISQSISWVGRRCCTRSFLLKSYCLTLIHLLPLVLLCQRGCLSFCLLRAGFP